VFVFTSDGIEDSERKELAQKFDWKKMNGIIKEIKL
jgi:hypothetical protein